MSLPGPLIGVEWLRGAMGDPLLLVADVRWYSDGSGRSRFEEGHIPGAVFVDVDTDLASPKTKGSGRHPLPSTEAFAEAMQRVGIGDEESVVAYDDAGGSNAARLWWMLSVTGHRAAVLDGGLQGWIGPLERGPSRPGPGRGRFTPRPWPRDRIVEAETVDRLRRDSRAVVLDARAPERYRGQTEPIDPVAGHIPGAGNAPWSENVDPGRQAVRGLVVGVDHRPVAPGGRRPRARLTCSGSPDAAITPAPPVRSTEGGQVRCSQRFRAGLQFISDEAACCIRD